MRKLVATLVCSTIGIGLAAAGAGSATLEDVIDHLQDNEKLVSEILAELKAQKLQAENVGCDAGRFDGDWRNLAGARTVPFECRVGKRKLTVNGTVHVYDDDGIELDRKAAESRERAIEFKQADITWKWQ